MANFRGSCPHCSNPDAVSWLCLLLLQNASLDTVDHQSLELSDQLIRSGSSAKPRLRPWQSSSPSGAMISIAHYSIRP